MKKENLIKIDKSKALELILNYMINKYGFNSLKRIKELQNLLRRFNLKRNNDLYEAYTLLREKVYSNKLINIVKYKNRKAFVINLTKKYSIRIEIENRGKNGKHNS